jgi:hypothetical protein
VTASSAGWQVNVGDQITASLADPPGGLYGLQLGARVEVPVTRAIVSAYQRGVLSAGIWTVTLEGLLEPGGYQFVWRTDDAEPPYYEAWIPITALAAGSINGAGTTDPFPPIDQDAIAPSADDVAALERSRIVEPGGQDPGTFTDTTHPKKAEVEILIEQAVDYTLNLLPYAVDPRHNETITRAVTLYAATLVEGSYFREQVDEGSVALYREMFEESIASINARVAEDYRQASVAGAAGAVILT